MTSTIIHSEVSVEDLIHEEEVRYNDAFRMNTEFQVLKSIRTKDKTT